MWKGLFWDKILERGFEIPNENIKEVILDEKSINATIVGAKEYKVSIMKDFSKMDCTCPCEGYYCKHEVALFRIIQKEYSGILNDNFPNSVLGSECRNNNRSNIIILDGEIPHITKEEELKNNIDSIDLKLDDLAEEWNSEIEDEL